jgi:xanthosine utilization system XapX-like protein
MSIMEAALELGRGAEPSTLIRRMLPHAAAALLLIVSEAAPIGTWAGLAGVVVGSAILLRSSSLAAQTTEADPLRSAWLNPIVALAACGQLLGDRAGLALPGVVGMLWWIVRLSGRPAAADSTYPALVAAGLLLAGGPDGELWRTPAAAAAAVQLAAAAILFGRRQWAPAVALGLSAFAVLALSQPGLTELLLGVLGLGLGAGASQAVQRILPRRSSDRGRRPLAWRIDIHDDLSRAWELVARWIRSGTELLEGQSAVLWMFLAVLAIVIAIGGNPG